MDDHRTRLTTLPQAPELVERIRAIRPWYSLDDLRVFVSGWHIAHAPDTDKSVIDRIASDEWDYFLKADEAREHLRQFVGRAALDDVIGDFRTLYPNVPNLEAIAAEEFTDKAQAGARLALLRPDVPPPDDEPSRALYEHYRQNPAYVDLKPDSLATVARRGNCKGKYNRMQRGDAAIEIQIDDGEFRAYSDELHAAQFWGRCEEVATNAGRPWREPTQKRRREMLLRWVGANAYYGEHGTDVVQDVLNALESLPDDREFVTRDLALEWARARRTTEEDAPNAVGNEVWTDIRKAFAAHGQRPGNDPWREDRTTVQGKRTRGWARREGRPTAVRLAGGEG